MAIDQGGNGRARMTLNAGHNLARAVIVQRVGDIRDIVIADGRGQRRRGVRRDARTVAAAGCANRIGAAGGIDVGEAGIAFLAGD